MSTSMEDLKLLQNAEEVCDAVWDIVAEWDYFPKKTVGEQLVRAVDSIGANIAESYGRYHYGEKINFLYYSRGSLFETKFWLRRAAKRKLMEVDVAKTYNARLDGLAKGINTFIKKLRQQRKQS